MIFVNAAKLWLENQKQYIKPSTYARYNVAIVNHLIPKFGLLNMKDLNFIELQKVVNYWKISGRLDGKGGLSSRSIRDLVEIYKQIVVNYYNSIGIPAPSCRIRAGVSSLPKKLNVYSQNEYRTFINLISKNDCRVALAVTLALQLGLRIGEICGLTWSNISFKTRTIRITQTIQRIYLKNTLGKNSSFINKGTPKTFDSCRELPFTDLVLKKLKLLYEIDCKDEFCLELYIITGNLKPTEPRALRARYKTLVEHCGMRYISFHSLRHTFATLLISRGAGEKTVSSILGHSSVKVTMDFYVHPQLEDKRKVLYKYLL